MKIEEISRDSNKFIGIASYTALQRRESNRCPCALCRGPFADMLIYCYAPEYHGCDRRTIRIIEGNARCRRLKKLACKETLRQVFICLRPRTPSPPYTHCIRVCSILIHTEKGGGWRRAEPERRLEEQPFTKLGQKIPT